MRLAEESFGGGEFGGARGRVLLDVARSSIEVGVATGKPLEVDPTGYDEPLVTLRSCFVTLRLDSALRGCVGALEATRPLVADVAQNAFAAAFRDPRFEPVTAVEIDSLEIHLSVLTSPEPLDVSTEEELLARVRPGVDGLVLSDGARRGTFLPAVWEQLPDPRSFVAALKRKAGLPPDGWSSRYRVERYTAESIP